MNYMPQNEEFGRKSRHRWDISEVYGIRCYEKTEKPISYWYDGQKTSIRLPLLVDFFIDILCQVSRQLNDKSFRLDGKPITKSFFLSRARMEANDIGLDFPYFLNRIINEQPMFRMLLKDLSERLSKI